MRKWICLVLVSASVLAACQSGEATTAAATTGLLTSGSEKACVAEDVEQTLRDMIEPDAEEISGSLEAKETGADSIHIEFQLTTQDAFDPAVSRMTCVTQVAISNGTETESSTLDFTVSPDAKDPENFVVWAQVQRPRALARSLAQSVADNVTVAEQRAAQLQEQRAAEERLVTMVKPSWLVGWWLERGGGFRGNCLQAGVEYRADGTFSHGSASGTWQMNGREITRTYDEEHSVFPLPLQSTVASANDNELVEEGPRSRAVFSRCSDDLIASLRERTPG